MLGVLIMNTGTPEAPTIEAIRPYLREFLSDRHIVDLPPFLWKPILNGIITRRPEKTVKHYRAFWTEEGSPFMNDCQALRRLLQEALDDRIPEDIEVVLAMRYGQPSIAGGVQKLLDDGADTIIALPLYPQKTIACAVTCFDEFDRQLATLLPSRKDQYRPRVVKIEEFWQAPGYLQALAGSVRHHWTWSPGDKLVVSFHSIPQSYVHKGDTYIDAARATTLSLATELGIPSEDVSIAFQSRFDNRRWVGPMLESELARLATAEGVTNVAVVAPIFTVDCIETTIEIGQANRKAFLEAAIAAGKPNARFTYVPALGCDQAFVEVLADIIKDSL